MQIKKKRERAAACAICFANDLQLPPEKRKTKYMEYTDSIIIEKILDYATPMTNGTHRMAEGFLVDLTDEQVPELSLVTMEVTIPQLNAPSDEQEPDWG